jgi:hypothetical protein
VLLAQRRGRLRLAAALGVWLASALLLRILPWTLGGAVALNGVVMAFGVPITRTVPHPPMPPLVRRRYDVPGRAALVALLVALVVGLSAQLGPALTGILAVFPVVLTSLILIFEPRIGARPTAALIAQAIPGLGGFAVALAVLQGAAVPLGAPAALALALAVSLSCNLALFIRLRRRL